MSFIGVYCSIIFPVFFSANAHVWNCFMSKASRQNRLKATFKWGHQNKIHVSLEQDLEISKSYIPQPERLQRKRATKHSQWKKLSTQPTLSSCADPEHSNIWQRFFLFRFYDEEGRGRGFNWHLKRTIIDHLFGVSLAGRWWPSKRSAVFLYCRFFLILKILFYRLFRGRNNCHCAAWS